MKSRVLWMVAIAGACLMNGCVTYTGVSKAADGQLYISGMTSYYVFSTAWVRRCDVEGTQLNCVELTEDKPRERRGEEPAGGSSAAAASSAAPSESKPSDSKKPAK